MKKLLSFSLCAVLLISFLTACRTTEPKKPINKPEPSINTPVDPTPEITPEPTQEPEIQPNEPVNIEPIASTDEVESQDIISEDTRDTIENNENGNIETTSGTEPALTTASKQEPKSNNQTNTGNSLAGNGDISINDDISSEEYAEIERQIREQIIQNGGTVTDSGRDGQIDRETEEYIGTHLNGGGGQSSSGGTSYGDDLTPEQYAEIERQMWAAFEESGGTYTDSGRNGQQISASEEEYIGTILNGGVQYNP